MIARERIPGPMPYPLRALLERDNQQDADTAARAAVQYLAIDLAHTARAWRLPYRSAARRAHRRAAMRARRAYAAELAELAPPTRSTDR